ncbi:hypothetical protein [Nocardia testacea]|uniref:hypothetical protein n=1 Tax=Nocardia testacea TaxID=248551 RepID=UPI0033E8BAB0
MLASSAVGSIAASGLAHRFLNASSAADTVPPEPTAPISDSTPKFTGNIAIVDVSGGEVVNTTSDLFPAGIQKYIADTEIYLASSPQAIFLESLGFTYPDKLTREEGEGDKRALHGDFESIPIGFHPRLAGYLIVSRSDSYAGSGSERGLPLMITNRGADLIVLDNPEAVEALRHWSSHSEKILLEQLVPLLEQTVS